MKSLVMGGYGAYVWASFGLTFIVLVGNVLWARARLNRTLSDITGASSVPEAVVRLTVREIE